MTEPNKNPDRHFHLALLLLTLAGFVLRFYCSTGDLWLDEIWSLKLAQQCHSPLDVFTKLHVENNHHLNTLMFYFLGDDQPFVVYRLLSILAGSATIPLVMLLAKRHGNPAAIFAGILTAFSYLLVHYSTEARGYALMVCLAMAAMLVAMNILDKPTTKHIVILNILLTLGLLSQLLFLLFIATLSLGMVIEIFIAHRNAKTDRVPHVIPPQAGGMCPPNNDESQSQSTCHEYDAPRNMWHPILRIAACFILPGATFLWLYAVDLRKIPPGGTDPSETWNVISSALSLTFGFRNINPFVIVYVGLLAYLFWRFNDALMRLSVVIILGLYCLPPLLSSPTQTPLAIRYFLIPIPLLYILMCSAYAPAFANSKAPRFVPLFVFLMLFGFYYSHLQPLLTFGHGQYLQAMQYLADNTKGNTIDISGDHDFRQAMLLDYYQRALPPEKKLEYHYQNNRPSNGTTWLITHAVQTTRPLAVAPMTIRDIHGNTYQLEKTFPCAPLSGFTWYLYRNDRDIKPSP